MKVRNHSIVRQPVAGNESHLTLSASQLDRIKNFADFLQSNPGTKNSIRQLSRLALMNDYDLKRMFRYVHGQTIHNFQVEHRLLQARTLLLNTTRSIAEIAEMCGYRPGYFTILFVRKIGMSPSAFRRQQIK